MYKNILVAVDNNEASQTVLHNAIETALAFRSKLTICHIRRNTIVYAPLDPTGMMDPTHLFLQDYSYPMDEDLENMQKRAEKAGVAEVEIVQTYSSSPGLAIAEVIAPGYEADLIICGASNKSGLDHFLLGSVSKNIVKHGKVDVKLVRTKKTT